jgi:hypothetical protein
MGLPITTLRSALFLLRVYNRRVIRCDALAIAGLMSVVTSQPVPRLTCERARTPPRLKRRRFSSPPRPFARHCFHRSPRSTGRLLRRTSAFGFPNPEFNDLTKLAHTSSCLPARTSRKLVNCTRGKVMHNRNHREVIPRIRIADCRNFFAGTRSCRLSYRMSRWNFPGFQRPRNRPG